MRLEKIGNKRLIISSTRNDFPPQFANFRKPLGDRDSPSGVCYVPTELRLAMSESAHPAQEWIPVTSADRELVLRELEAILASYHFRGSKRYPALLKYVVKAALDGHSGDLKERTLGVEVFGSAQAKLESALPSTITRAGINPDCKLNCRLAPTCLGFSLEGQRAQKLQATAPQANQRPCRMITTLAGAVTVPSFLPWRSCC